MSHESQQPSHNPEQPKPVAPNLDAAEQALAAFASDADQGQGQGPQAPESNNGSVDPGLDNKNSTDGNGIDPGYQSLSELSGPLENDKKPVPPAKPEEPAKPKGSGAEPASKPASANPAAEAPAETPEPAHPTEKKPEEPAKPASPSKAKDLIKEYEERLAAWEDGHAPIKPRAYALVDDLLELSASELKDLTPKDVKTLPDTTLLEVGKDFLKRLPAATREAWKNEAAKLKAVLIELTPEDIRHLAKENPDELQDFSPAQIKLLHGDTLKEYQEHAPLPYGTTTGLVHKVSRALASLHPEVAKERIELTKDRNEEAAEARKDAAAEAKAHLVDRLVTEDEVGENSQFIGMSDKEIIDFANDDEKFNALSDEDQDVLTRLKEEAEQRDADFMLDHVLSDDPEAEKPSKAIRVAAAVGGVISKAQEWNASRGANKPNKQQPDDGKSETPSAEGNQTPDKGWKERAKELAEKVNTNDIRGRAQLIASGALSLLPKATQKLDEWARTPDEDGKKELNNKGRVLVAVGAGVLAIAAIVGISNLVSDNQDTLQQGADAAANMSTSSASSSASQGVETTTQAPVPSTSKAAEATTTVTTPTPTGTSSQAAQATTTTPSPSTSSSVANPGDVQTPKPPINPELTANDLRVEFSPSTSVLPDGGTVWDSSEQYFHDVGMDQNQEQLTQLTDALKDWRLKEMGLLNADGTENVTAIAQLQPGTKLPMPSPAQIHDWLEMVRKG